ncbi:hypothetical protein J6590_077413 [Homalodisca vitripennis]|nr:hypothetical protein J6590_077413 [Homalodisca vitripennis]
MWSAGNFRINLHTLCRPRSLAFGADVAGQDSKPYNSEWMTPAGTLVPQCHTIVLLDVHFRRSRAVTCLNCELWPECQPDLQLCTALRALEWAAVTCGLVWCSIVARHTWRSSTMPWLVNSSPKSPLNNFISSTTHHSSYLTMARGYY